MRSQNGSTWLGIILIALGVLFFLSRSFDLGGSIWLLGIGTLFLIGYIAQRAYGFLIPACILLGLGLGELIDMSSLGLGLGFIAIFAVDTLVYRAGASRRAATSNWWPLIPGVIISASAIGDIDRNTLEPIQQIVRDGWPLLLIAIGVLILIGSFSRRQVS